MIGMAHHAHAVHDRRKLREGSASSAIEASSFERSRLELEARDN